MLPMLFISMLIAGLFSIGMGATAGWVVFAILAAATLFTRVVKPEWFEARPTRKKW